MTPIDGRRRSARARERCAPDRSRPSIAASPDRSVASFRPCRRRTRCDRLGVGGGKHVDDAAADGERAVLVDGILAREARVDEQVGQSLRLDLGAGLSSIEARSRRSCDSPAAAARRRRDHDQAGGPGRRGVQRAARAAPRGSAASCRGMDRPESREAEAPPARPPRPTRLRARHRRTARRRSSARRPDRSGRRAASSAPAERAAWTAASALLAGVSPAVIGARPSADTTAVLPSSERSDSDGAVVVTRRLRDLFNQAGGENPSAGANDNRAARAPSTMSRPTMLSAPQSAPLTSTSG